MTSDIRNPFDAPIPGQSLTDEPGNNRWEHPPQFVNMDEASEYVWELLHEPTKLEQTILLLNSGVSIEALTKGILFSGFVEGKWTPDLADFTVSKDDEKKQMKAIGKIKEDIIEVTDEQPKMGLMAGGQ